jgi:hypothetical protein
MKIVVPNEGTIDGSKLKLVGVVGTEIGPTRAAKYMKSGIVGSGTKEAMQGHVIGKKFSGGVVYEVGSREEHLVPIFQWHRCISEKRKAYFYDVAVLAFCSTILLMCMWT